MNIDSYKKLAEQLNALPNGFPSTDDGREIKLLAKLFTPEEAELAAQLLPSLETIEEMSARTERDARELRNQLKSMSRRGLIEAGRRKDGALGFKLLPFVVGIYEMQVATMDAELARLFENYFQQFGQVLSIKPQVHRVIPIGETVRNTMEVRPFESAADIVNGAQSWGVVDCICRKQKALIGQGCDHPLDVCMVLNQKPNAFDNNTVIRSLNLEGALSTLRRAAEAGLVHSVSNSKEGFSYICNCCTCSCGILRGMAELGIANVVARSAFINQVDETICGGCEDCITSCQFKALSMDDMLAKVNSVRCTGCGVCVLTCPTGALGLVRRPDDEVMQIPQTLEEWGAQRIAERGGAD